MFLNNKNICRSKARAAGGYTVILLCALSALAAGCKKNSEYPANPTVLQLFNAMDDGLTLRTNYSGRHPIAYHAAQQLWNKEFSLYNSNYIDQFPQSLALYEESDTLDKSLPLIDIQLDVEPGSIYSLFLYGGKNNASYLLHHDEHPRGNFGDSLSFIRFVNLCADQPVRINLKDQPPGSTVDNVSFRQVTNFQALRISASTISFDFEVRDAVTGNLITTYSTPPVLQLFAGRNLWLNKSNTLVFTGIKGGSGSNTPELRLMHHFF